MTEANKIYHQQQQKKNGANKIYQGKLLLNLGWLSPEHHQEFHHKNAYFISIKHVFGCTVIHQQTPFLAEQMTSPSHEVCVAKRMDCDGFIVFQLFPPQIKFGDIWSPHLKCSQFFNLRGKQMPVWKGMDIQPQPKINMLQWGKLALHQDEMIKMEGN